MTIILIVIIIFCFALIGFKFSSYYVSRKKFFSSLVLMLSNMEADVVFSRDKLANILKKNTEVCASKELCLLCENMMLAIESKQLIDEKLFDSVKILKTDEKQLLYKFFSQLGRYDVTTQSKEIKTYQTRINDYNLQAQEECKKYSGLFIKLGIIVGILVCLLII